MIILILIALIILFVIRNTNKVNQELVDEVYSYLGSNDLSYSNGLYSYDKDKIKSQDLAVETKLCNAYINTAKDKISTKELKAKKDTNICTFHKKNFAVDNYEGDVCTLKVIDTADLALNLTKIYHTTMEKYPDFNVDDNTICRYYEGKYYCGLAETIVYSTAEEPKTYRVVKKTVEKGDYLYIYDLYLKIKENKCYLNNTTDKDEAKCSTKYQNIQKVNVNLLKKYGQKYKHTFKLDPDTKEYYWVSSEAVK